MHRLLLSSALLLLAPCAVARAQPAIGMAGALDPAARAQASDPLEGSRFAGIPGTAQVLAGAPLRTGAAGPATAAVQGALVDMGFALPSWASGPYGELTRRAVTNFQTHARVAFPDVQVSGEVDAATLRALAALAPPAGQRGQRGNTPSNLYDGTPVRIVVVKAERRTFVFDRAGRVTHIFLDAVGAPGSPTDSALKRVQGRLGKAIAAAMGRRLWHDAGAFGDRIVNLTGGGQELHGTAASSQLGLEVSHGCVRHANADIVTIFGLVAVGDAVAIVDRLDDPHLGPPAPLASF